MHSGAALGVDVEVRWHATSGLVAGADFVLRDADAARVPGEVA
jgi:hypothetical protein